MNTHQLQLATVPFDAITSGAKTIESRLYDEKRQTIQIGDTIVFTNRENTDQTVSVKVIGLLRYETFHDLFSHNNPAKFGGESVEWLENQINEFYSVEQQKQGGVDHVGHFSAGQYMFIAEQDGQRVGIIHVVEKKQETVKISPLIVSTDYRGKLGIGSMLLKHAEDFARNLGARQLYCTVASPNQKALQFFLRKGFHITGTAKDHYKNPVDGL